jgi:hypothetical protein
VSLSIAGAAALSAPSPATALGRTHPMREAMRDLRQALRSSDLDASREAYAAILKNAPEGAQFPRGTEFASIGRALATGDMAAAQQAFKNMFQGRIDAQPVTPMRPVADAPAASAPKVAGIDIFA